MRNFKAADSSTNELGPTELSTNIQEQKSLLAALQLAEERSAMLAAIVDSSDDAIISKNLNGVVTSWNLSAQRIFGYSAEEMIGESIMKLIPKDRAEEEPKILSVLKSGQRVDHFETQRVTKQGRLIDVSLTISPVKNTTGKIIGLSKIARDITDKKLEEQRKNDFIAIASHELKTPLTSVRSYIQLALAKARNSSDAFTENILSRAEVQTTRMVAMIHDFLDLSRLEDGKMSLNLSRFTLVQLMDDLMAEAKILAPSHIITYQGCTNLEMYADREKISQVLSNLLSNAVKYSLAGTFVRIDCTREQNNVSINFTDQGVGIDLLDQPRLFERFYRVKNEQLKNVSGFGIGLHLVSEILKLHGSEIRVKSQPGKGSTFYFILPVYID
ncbi:PAS domain S-box protein [Pedobacter panaciterrae]|jgi:PAS domain S-box|uniref:sensor histidine kinase n=1 Tax=Pedobacter panaciterrae TaxID=363849 RepID=UPI00155DCAEC|nr:PAS domain S-box protein [Pedobacter panaciterrae]NQX56121.1 PAS domain S-box protein [Pedobacter panaciterrae]